jgi:hypothetical protein
MTDCADQGLPAGWADYRDGGWYASDGTLLATAPAEDACWTAVVVEPVAEVGTPPMLPETGANTDVMSSLAVTLIMLGAKLHHWSNTKR